jgi:hypothetical protein
MSKEIQVSKTEVPAFLEYLCPAGYARVTRDGAVDIYHVVNEETLAGEGVSFATTMDDYDPENSGRLYGKTIVLYRSDMIEFLGAASAYFSEGGEFFTLTQYVYNLLPESAGFLPKVRAVEVLKSHTGAITEGLVQSTASLVYIDYLQRRAALTVMSR